MLQIINYYLVIINRIITIITWVIIIHVDILLFRLVPILPPSRVITWGAFHLSSPFFLLSILDDKGLRSSPLPWPANQSFILRSLYISALISLCMDDNFYTSGDVTLQSALQHSCPSSSNSVFRGILWYIFFHIFHSFLFFIKERERLYPFWSRGKRDDGEINPTSMQFTEEQAGEVKKWVVKRLEDM
jgi:hypothetical protein